MTALQLPAHLQGRQSRGLAARAAEGMGSSLPPHISIQGNKFTFIDASGNEMPPMLSFDGYIVDVSDHMNKRYYDKKFDPSQNSYEPPACWSANGIAPSREAVRPQAARCDLCPQNERGSATSAMSGAAIKACRDERWLAVVNPAIGEMLFQLIVTPGSFKNWKAFIATLENYGVEPEMMLTRFQFEDKTNGVLTFTAINFTPPEHIAVIDRMLAEKKSDAIVGRLDQPRTMALPGPQQGTAAQLPPNQFAPNVAASAPAGAQPPQGGFAPQQEIIPPGAPAGPGFQPSTVQAPFGAAQTAGAPSMPMGGPGGPQGGFPSTAAPASGFPSEQAPAPQQQPTQRRRRNSAANVAPQQNAAPAASVASPGGFQPSAPPQAPFGAPPAGNAPIGAGPGFGTVPPGAPTASPSSPPAGNTFGIGGGAPVDPAMSQMLGNLFRQPS